MSRLELSSVDGWLRVNTWKEGLLSKMGHDLLINIEDFSLVMEGELEGPWKADLTVKKDSFQATEPTSLSAKDRADIHKNICKVFPSDIKFVGEIKRDSETKLLATGKVSVGKNQAPIRFYFDLDGQQASGRVSLTHSALKLKPFKAPLGVIRIKDQVDVSFSFDLSEWFDG